MVYFKKFLYSQKIAPYVFVLPFAITFIIFFIYPISNTVLMSFQNVLPGQSTFIGLKNYTKMLNDKLFYKAVANSVTYMLWTLVLLIPVPMIFAYLVNNKLFIGKTLFKSSFYIPALTSVVVAGTIFRLVFSEQPNALMNTVIAAFGMAPIKWLKVKNTGFFTLITLACWRWTGVNMLYFLSGLQGISPELYESADIDGASEFQKFMKITMPLLKSTIIYVLTISIYAGLAMFTESFMLYNGNASPNNIGLTIVGYLYRQGWEQNNMGYASAVGLVLLAIAMAINLTQLKLTGTLKKAGD